MIKETNKSDISKTVVCFTNVPWSSAVFEIRLKLPLEACGYNIIQGNNADKLLIKDFSVADFVVIQRDFPRHVELFFRILDETRKHKIPLIYEIDDLLFELPEDHPDRQIHHYTSGLMPILTAVNKSDLVTVSTQSLADYLQPFNQRISVLKNCLADSYWPMSAPVAKKNDHSGITIGYVGTATHRPDLELILKPLITVGEKYGSKVTFKFFGINPPAEISSRFQVRWIPEIYNYWVFAQRLSREDIDILVAPLKDNEFGKSKSSIKFLEYSSLGVPAIYSRTIPYEEVVVHGETGYLASSPEEWIHYLQALIEDPDLRYRMGTNALEDVRKNWLLSQQAYQWAEAYHQAGHRKNFPSNEIRKQELVLENALKLQTAQVSSLTAQIFELKEKVRESERAYQETLNELTSLKNSRSWKLFILILSAFRRMVPPGTTRDRIFTQVWRSAHLAYRAVKTSLRRLSSWMSTRDGGSRISIPPVSLRSDFTTHQENVDVVICVHNALDDVQRCLESVVQYTTQPYSIILVDDGSDAPTKGFLQEFVERHDNSVLIRNEKAGGYTRAANQGLKQSKAPYVVLLNSDTLVGPEWIDRMCLAMRSDEQVGIVGPLSNTASWQSIPRLSEDGDWAGNVLPDGISAAMMSRLIAKYSARLYFQVPLLNGFCMMVRRAVIEDVGLFDEEKFGQGYGEEDDFNLRAQKKGWKLAVADDVYVYHAQSKSYSNERRHALSQRAGTILKEKHGEGIIQQCVEYMNPNRIMEGIRAMSCVVADREQYLHLGRQEFSGKRLLFVLPVMDAGGGANVVIDEARAMRSMGVDVQIFNLNEYKSSFLASYPHLDIPTIFGRVDRLSELRSQYDACIATANYSVEWLKPLEGQIKLGYYIQGFEPLMYPQQSPQARKALSSYSLIQGLKRFTKTEWVRKTVFEHTGMDSDVIGISVNVDLFRPRDGRALGKKPVTITAMIRPESPYRSPELTLAVLRRIQKEFGKAVNIVLFGTDSLEEHGALFELDFEWKLAGKLTQLQVARLLSNSDIFVDFSTHQAMGLTALEAMACGCSVIVPQEGGAIEFVRNRENGLVVPVINRESCYWHLKNLVEDDYLRQRTQIAAMKSVSRFFPEKTSFNILRSLFS